MPVGTGTRSGEASCCTTRGATCWSVTCSSRGAGRGMSALPGRGRSSRLCTWKGGRPSPRARPTHSIRTRSACGTPAPASRSRIRLLSSPVICRACRGSVTGSWSARWCTGWTGWAFGSWWHTSRSPFGWSRTSRSAAASVAVWVQHAEDGLRRSEERKALHSVDPIEEMRQMAMDLAERYGRSGQVR